MANNAGELRRIQWTECFPFVHLFKTFRLSVHPSKLALCLIGVIATCLSGVILDGLWPSRFEPVEGELNAYWQVSDVDAWRARQSEAIPQQLREAYVAMGVEEVPSVEDLETALAKNPAEPIDKALEKLEAQYESATKELTDTEEDREKTAAIAAQMNRIHAELESLKPQGVFDSFIDYQVMVMHQAIDAARGLNAAGELGAVLGGPGDAIAAGNLNLQRILAAAGQRGEAVRPVLTGPDGIGVLPCVVLMIRGVQWLIVEHPFYAILFLAGFLVIWSVIGAAVCRMAALNVGRDERIQIKTAVEFAQAKFFSFLAAPLLPVGMIVGVGLAIFLGGLLIVSIPYVGEVLGGLGLGLSLIGGFVMTLLIFGAIGGLGLMWPAIAVERSDSFDALSRSYNYVYSRPWHLAFYVGVATVYGSIVYLFARFFAMLVLGTTRFFTELGVSVWSIDRPGTGDAAASKIDAMWPTAGFADLHPAIPPFGMENWEPAGAFLMWLWVLLVGGLVFSLLASFYLSGSTIIYLLLRRNVDATDMDDVYVEDEEAFPSDEMPPIGADSSAEKSEPSAGSEPASAGASENATTSDSPAERSSTDEAEQAQRSEPDADHEQSDQAEDQDKGDQG